MSNFSKSFRKTKWVNFVIVKKRHFFKKFRLYSFLRNMYLEKKWWLKFNFYSNYIEVSDFLSINYTDIKVFRPKDAFSDFDISFIGKAKKDNKKVFIQVLLKNINNEDDFNRKMESFSLKNIYYNLFHQTAVRDNKHIGQYTVNTTEFNVKNRNFCFLVSEFRDFIPLKKFIKTKIFQKKDVRDALIMQLNFYLDIFNKMELFWTDPSIHNIMVVQNNNNYILVPLDFVGSKENAISKIKRNNAKVVKDITKYLMAQSTS